MGMLSYFINLSIPNPDMIIKHLLKIFAQYFIFFHKNPPSLERVCQTLCHTLLIGFDIFFAYNQVLKFDFVPNRIANRILYQEQEQ